MDLLCSRGKALGKGSCRALVELCIELRVKLRVEICVELYVKLYTELCTKLYAELRAELCVELYTGLRAECDRLVQMPLNRSL